MNAQDESRASELREVIAGITAQMRGPLSNWERICLHHDRKDLRAELARIESPRATPAETPAP